MWHQQVLKSIGNMNGFEIMNSELLNKTLVFMAKVGRDTSVTPTSIEIPRKYGCVRNHELGIVNKALVFISKVERGSSVTNKY